ncbi:MAG: PKD domain-containing protein [Blastocatellia bacterium]
MKRIIIALLAILPALLLSRELFDRSAFAMLSGVAAAQAATDAELPRVYLDTTYPANTGAMINVARGGDLQAALNQAQPGDQVVLEAGAVFTGNFVLPAKIGSGWIIIRTSNLAGLPAEATRADASSANAMPRLLTPNTMPAIKTAAAAHHYRLVGLEIGISPNWPTNYGIVALGDTGAAQSSMAQVAHDLVIDRCYIHGNAAGDVSRGVALNSGATAIIDSTIANCHGVGFDTQAIGGWNGPGPFKIVNNYLEGAGENFMFGGADPSIPNLVSSDIEFCRNFCAKPLSWCASEPSYAGVHWSVKNLFELKNAQRVLVDGNVFEGCWLDGQTGFAIQLTPRNQDGAAPWATVQDITFTNNIVRHAAAGINILGTDNLHPSQRAQHIKIKNNLFDDIGGARWGGNGRLFQIIDGPAYVQIDHNTAFQTGNVVTADGTPCAGFIFSNNLMPHNDYGVLGSGYGIGLGTLNYFFPACVFARNVLVGGPGAVYPANNFFPAQMSAVGFVDLAGGNYRLALNSPYHSAATDGTDIGADFNALQTALGGGSAGNQPPHVNVAATPVSGTAPLNVAFTSNASDSDGQIVAYNWSFGDGQSATEASPTHLYQSAGTFTAQLTVTDNSGAAASSSVVISVTAPPSNAPTVVLYAAEARVRGGNWQIVADATAAGRARFWNPDRGAAKVTTASPSPADYFEMTFNAEANTPYHLWIRGKAQNDSPFNDSVHVQFSDSVSAGGAAVFRIGTTDSTVVNLEDDLNVGVSGWGWQDNGWGVGVMGPALYFASSGPHTLRVQVREDGFSIDQIVLSPSTYLNSSPGALKNDTVILPKPTVPLSLTSTSPNSGTGAGGMTVNLNGTGFLAGAGVSFDGAAAVSVTVINDHLLTAVTPPHAAGGADVTVINPDNASAMLAAGYTYLQPNHPPQVNPTASVSTGAPPLPVNFVANATDPDGDMLNVNWDFGDAQTAAGANVSHTYTNPGQYTATVTATDPAGAIASATVTIVVNPFPRPVVQVSAPVNGQRLFVDSTTTISWTVDSDTLLWQEIQLSVDGGRTWLNVAANLSPALRNYTWRVPNLPTKMARIRVRVYDHNRTIGEGMNAGKFYIVSQPH